LLFLLGFVTLSSSHASLPNKEPQPVIVQISLNGIKPGPITVEQLLIVNKIRVFSIEAGGKEKEYKIKFCRIALLPVSGKSSKIDMESNYRLIVVLLNLNTTNLAPQELSPKSLHPYAKFSSANPQFPTDFH
jgi:hypothetical protein